MNRITHRIAKAKARNPAEIYNEKRRIVITEFMKDPVEARKWLDGYRNTLGPKGYVGLKAELDFFEKYVDEFGLVPTLDAGNSTDFAGTVDNATRCFDVTTNIKFKKLGKYEPMQLKGRRYTIAVFDGNGFEFVDIKLSLLRGLRERANTADRDAARREFQ